jgi:hypothetical protein
MNKLASSIVMRARYSVGKMLRETGLGTIITLRTGTQRVLQDA